eukprot:TRINITY_DN709_c0_g1_i4.p1 TRINITY_DN709_c0_g1~~TRINITY_DN709_c0_g1_i4.p1  ORF type:complete len:516 (+),score=68.51 TRINITY_DN709_c0_g1_i4:518-2065(+)
MPVSPPSAASDEATLTGTVDPHFSKFWQELLRDPSLPSGTVRFFETNVLAGGKAGRAFFMRPVYEDILSTLSGYFNRFQNARERVDFAMTGTPGIGKTYFATCLLASLVRQFASRTPDENFVVYPNAPAIVYVDDEGHALRLLWTTGTVVRVDYDHLLSLPSSSLVILDGIHPKHGELLNGVREGRVVWIASPRNTATSLTNPFQKFVNSECYIICMPVMSEWEVFQAEAAWRNIAGQDDAAREKRRREVRERFHQCGGVARALFGDPFDVRGNAAFEWFESTLRSEDEDEVRLAVRTVNFANIDLYSKVRHRLVHCVSGRKGDNPFALVNMEFASKYVATTINVKFQLICLERLKNVSPGGLLFEGYVNRLLTAPQPTGPRRLRRLDTGNGMEEEGELPHGLDIVFVHSRNECEPATTSQVVIPLTTSFPSVDAYTSEWMIQDTSAERHPIKWTRELQRICGFFQRPRFLFVVPNEARFRAFTKQNIVESIKSLPVPQGCPFEQWVMLVEAGLQ